MKIARAFEMRRIDSGCGVPTGELMQNAAAACARALDGLHPDLSQARVVIVCGKGNNGGDGFTLAHKLLGRVASLDVFTVAAESALTGDAAENFRVARDKGVRFIKRAALDEALNRADLIVDALLGTGLQPRPLSATLQEVIAAINEARLAHPLRRVLAVDIPSGVCSDTGQVRSIAVQATRTVTFGCAKPGHLLFPGVDYCGELMIDGIGIPPASLAELPGEEPEDADIARLLPERPALAHKGHAKMLIVGGGEGMSGAVQLAAQAALRANAGYVFLARPRGALDNGWPVEAVRKPVAGVDGAWRAEAADEILALAERMQTVVLGNGMGRTEEARAVVASLLGRCSSPLVIDADALHLMRPVQARAADCCRILTPHAAEFAALFGGTIEEVEADRLGHALAAAMVCDQVVVLKGRPTIIAAPDGRYRINPTGDERLATCGSGDVLAGIAGALLAQLPGLAFEAATAAAFLHGRAAELWPYPIGLTAGDLPNLIPDAWRSILASRTPHF